MKTWPFISRGKTENGVDLWTVGIMRGLLSFLPRTGHKKEKKLESTGITTLRRQVGKVAAKKSSRQGEEGGEEGKKSCEPPQTTRIMMISCRGSWLTWWLWPNHSFPGP